MFTSSVRLVSSGYEEAPDNSQQVLLGQKLELTQNPAASRLPKESSCLGEAVPVVPSCCIVIDATMFPSRAASQQLSPQHNADTIPEVAASPAPQILSGPGPGTAGTSVALSPSNTICPLQSFAQLKFSGRLPARSPRIHATHARKSPGKTHQCAQQADPRLYRHRRLYRVEYHEHLDPRFAYRSAPYCPRADVDRFPVKDGRPPGRCRELPP
jgi:hypothetical protein